MTLQRQLMRLIPALLATAWVSAKCPDPEGIRTPTFPLEWGLDGYGFAGVYPDARCDHACTHTGYGVRNCGGQNPCTRITWSTLTFSNGVYWRTTTYGGGTIRAEDGDYFCCKSTQSHEHIATCF